VISPAWPSCLQPQVWWFKTSWRWFKLNLLL